MGPGKPQRRTLEGQDPLYQSPLPLAWRQSNPADWGERGTAATTAAPGRSHSQESGGQQYQTEARNREAPAPLLCAPPHWAWSFFPSPYLRGLPPSSLPHKGGGEAVMLNPWPMASNFSKGQLLCQDSGGGEQRLRDKVRTSNSTGAPVTPTHIPGGLSTGLSALACPGALPDWPRPLALTLVPPRHVFLCRNGRMTFLGNHRAIASYFPTPMTQTGISNCREDLG